MVLPVECLPPQVVLRDPGQQGASAPFAVHGGGLEGREGRRRDGLAVPVDPPSDRLEQRVDRFDVFGKNDLGVALGNEGAGAQIFGRVAGADGEGLGQVPTGGYHQDETHNR